LDMCEVKFTFVLQFASSPRSFMRRVMHWLLWYMIILSQL